MIGLIFFAFYLIATQKSIETITFPSGCKEVIINGKINGSYCQDDRDAMDKNNMVFDLRLINTSNLYK